MDVFQAREIMEICLMPRNRFDYIVKKVGIKADVKKAAGRGSTNLYSYKALFCFAIAQALLVAGQNHGNVSAIIDGLKSQDKQKDLGLFKRDVKSTGIISYRFFFGKQFFGIYLEEQIELLLKPDMSEKKKQKDNSFNPKHVEIKVDIGVIKRDLNTIILNDLHPNLPIW